MSIHLLRTTELGSVRKKLPFEIHRRTITLRLIAVVFVVVLMISRKINQTLRFGKFEMAKTEHIQGDKASNLKAASHTAVATELTSPLDEAGFPHPEAWNNTQPVLFNTDWTGENVDPQLETEVRLLWTPSSIYLKFRARYRTITVFDDADPSGRRDHLWDRDVVEVFLQPDPSVPRRYKEIEIAPNGFWIDLDVDHGQLRNLKSGMQRRIVLGQPANTWTAEVSIPMKSLTDNFQPDATWHVNFFRVEGASEPRFYSAWRPTKTPQPNFHAPEAFAPLIFQRAIQ
jgi:hypothetical protein